MFIWQLLGIAIAVLIAAGMWKVFVKAGQPGWAAIIPFYNMYVLLEIVREPRWWMIMFFIPFVNIVFLVLTCLELASRFGKEVVFGLGLIFLPFIFFPILGFDVSTYTPPGGPPTPSAPAPPPPPPAPPR